MTYFFSVPFLASSCLVFSWFSCLSFPFLSFFVFSLFRFLVFSFFFLYLLFFSLFLFSNWLASVVRMRSDRYYVQYMRGSLSWVAGGMVAFGKVGFPRRE